MDKYPPLVVIAVVVVISGCFGPNSGGQIGITGEFDATDTGFQLDGNVVNSGRVTPTYHNVTVFLFRGNGSAIALNAVGTLEIKEDLTLQSTEIPKYIVVHSPGFWEQDQISVSYYKYREADEIYAEDVIGSRDELPVRVPADHRKH